MYALKRSDVRKLKQFFVPFFIYIIIKGIDEHFFISLKNRRRENL